MKRDNNINIRIESDLKHKFFEYAKELKVSPSSLIHWLIKNELNEERS